VVLLFSVVVVKGTITQVVGMVLGMGPVVQGVPVQQHKNLVELVLPVL
jgi:hypothetical protein